MAKAKKPKKVVLVDKPFPSTSGRITEGDVITEASKSLSYDPEFLADVLLKFGGILTGMTLYSYQRDFAWRIFLAVVRFEGAVLTALWSRQSGKSETMAFVVDTLMVIMPTLGKIYSELEQYKGGYQVGLFAPQSDQVYMTYNRAMLRLGTENAAMVMSDPDLGVYLESEVHLNLSNGSFTRGQIASKLSKIESATYDLVIAEESQDIEDFIINKSIEPMVSATGGTILKVGTTGVRKNHFYVEIQINKQRDRKVKDIRHISHFEFDYKKVIAARREQYDIDRKPYHLHYENDIMRKIGRKGTETEEFKLSYALKWSLETGMLITDSDWDRMINKRLGLNAWEDADEISAGLDIGKVINSSVLTIGKRIINEDDEFAPPKKQIIAWYELINMDYEAQHHTILDILIQHNVRKLAADYTGVGKPVVDRLMYACGEYVKIIPYVFSRQSKSEMYYKFTADIASGRLIVPANKTTRETEEYANFEEQMKNCQKFHDGPYLVCEKSEGFKDDYVDSAALMGIAVEDGVETAMEIEEDDNDFYSDIERERRSRILNSY